MKKKFFLSALALGAMTVSAQTAYVTPSFGDNWSIGINGGVQTPLKNHPFFDSMRGAFGANISKQITPTYGVGVEGQATINTSPLWGMHSSTAIDASYVGAFGKVNLMNLFGGDRCGDQGCFNIEAVAGAGWGHDYYTKAERPDHNYFATKAGLNFNFVISPNVTFTLQPSVVWDMSDARSAQSTASYDARCATFNLTAGFNFGLGGKKFPCVVPYNQAQIDALNGQINDLRAQLQNAVQTGNQWQTRANQLKSELDACNSRAPQTIVQTEVVTETNNFFNTVRYVFFKIGSSTITPDQMPNVEQIATYLKNHPDAIVNVKGYASQDGPEDVNIRLANNRAAAVKNALVNKYGINANRINAEGQGIGHMFQEESWNRVSICIIEADNE